MPELPALTMAKFAEYVLGENTPYKTIGMKPGEKLHEVLVTSEEFRRVIFSKMDSDHFVIGNNMVNDPLKNYSSFGARQMKKEEMVGSG